MTVPDWLARMNPPPPEELARAIGSALPHQPENPTPAELLTAAVRLLDKVLRTDCEARSSAMDLLAVDALVTHALLRASEDPGASANFAREALQRVSAAWE